MCGRYGFTFTDKKKVYERWDIEKRNLKYKPSYNIAPMQKAPIITRHSPNKITLATWGYIPEWMKDKKGARALINARSDKLMTSKTFKKPLQFSRCIVPASYFFEWKRVDEKSKIPYLIKLKDGELFGFAGLVLENTFVIITTEPNELMETIHTRMPVMLTKEKEEVWLSPDQTDSEELIKLLTPYDSKLMLAYPVSSLVNSPKNNFPEITHKFK